MQNRYKINSSNEGRKSSTNTAQPHKADTLSYINLLDKCTQILREDRIWIRNQLKANDEEIYKIFKQAKRPINLQHLQIRLRKHVTLVKSKAKMEQLIKFKENMHLGQWTQPDDKSTVQAKKQSIQKYHLPSNAVNNSSSEARGLKARLNHSVDKNTKSNSLYPYRGTSANSKKNIQHFPVLPAPMEQITERQSQNMTSARHRVFQQDNAESFTFSHSYQPWKRPEASNTQQVLGSNYVNDPFKPKYNQNVSNVQSESHSSTGYFNNFIMGDKQITKQKPQMLSPTHQAPKIQTSFTHTLSPTGNMKSQKFSRVSESNTQNMKKSNNVVKETDQLELFNAMEKSRRNFMEELEKSRQSRDNYSNNSQIISNNYFEDFSPNGQKFQGQSQLISGNNYLDALNMKSYEQKYKIKDQSYLPKQNYSIKTFNNDTFKPISHLQETNLLLSKTSAVPFTSNTNSDSLFTSPELLAECRNFLKLKSSAKPSIQKQYGNRFPLELQTKFQPLKFDHIEPIKISENHKQIMDQYPNSQSSMIQMFNEINCGMTSSIAQYQQSYFPPQQHVVQTIQSQKIQPAISISPEPIKQSAYTQKQTQKANDLSGHQQYFHTFAGLSSKKKQAEEILTPQSFVDLVFQNISGQPEGFVYWQTLQRLASRKLPQYKEYFKQYLYPTDEQKLVLISNIGRLLEDQLADQRVEPVEGDARNIYRLLDIEQKGYIVEQDIEDFLRQLQDSQAEDIQIISQYIWKLFQIIDQDAQQADGKRIDYWGIYSKKNSPQFSELNQILKQFEFQIE